MARIYTDAGAYPMYMDVQTTAPLDNRVVVEYISDLTENENVLKFPYVGLVVYVVEDQMLHACTEFNPLAAPGEKTKWKLAGGDDFAGTNGVTSLTNVPVNKSTVIADLDSDQALSLAEGLANGREVLIVAHNIGSDDITITLPGNCND